MGRKRKQTRYWDVAEDEALKEYLATQDIDLRNKIFEEKLYMPLYKMCEVWTNKSSKYAQFEEFHNKLMIHLIHNIIPTMDFSRKSSAFTLLTLACRHYSWNENNRNYEHSKRFVFDCDSTNQEDETASVLDRLAFRQSTEAQDMFPADFDWETFRQRMIARMDVDTIEKYAKSHKSSARATARVRMRRALHTLGVRLGDNDDKFARKNVKRLRKPSLKAMKWFKPVALEVLREMDPERFGD